MPQWLKDAEAVFDSGDKDRALELLTESRIDKAIENLSHPERVFVLYGIAQVLKKFEQKESAEKYYKELDKTTSYSVVNYEIAAICKAYGRITESIGYLEKAAQLRPNSNIIWNSMGVALMSTGQKERSVECIRKAVELEPGNSKFHSNLLFSMHYLSEIGLDVIFQEHKKWSQIHTPASLQRTSHSNDAAGDRRLRIGYVSSDFRTHSVSYFFPPLLSAHDRGKFEIYGYGNVESPDDVTNCLKAGFDVYRDIFEIDDESVANMIADDRIDILVDLGGHTGDNRLPVFGYKPAPIQVSYLGYPDTTGADAIDYRLTDTFANTPQSQKYYSEELVFLPQSFLCYLYNNSAPAIAISPVMKNGYITFGSFNTNHKINRPLISLWSQILKANENSRFILKFLGGNDKEQAEYYYQQFAEFGIDRKRVAICGKRPFTDHLAMYEKIDIALDTYPYNGTTTTCEALWMGVPVISLVGQMHMSRVGFSILSNMGLEFFAAKTPQEYVAKATALALKPEALNKIRGSMRSRMSASPVCNKNLLARNIEDAYRKMWVKWCRQQNSSAAVVCDSLSEGRHDQVLSGQLSSIAKLAVLVDEFLRAGRRAEAYKCAAEGYERVSKGEKAPDVPDAIFRKWDVANEAILFLKICIALNAFSSYFNVPHYMQMFKTWLKIEPDNMEPYIRLGLASALQYLQQGRAASEQTLELLEYVDGRMKSDRSAAALGLARGEISGLSLPYDGCRIHVYPELTNITTYVLLEQQDWFEQGDLSLFRKLIRHGDRVLDLGANVGVYSLSAAVRTGDDGCVVAVEPSSRTFRYLRESAKQFDHMQCFHCGVSDSSSIGSLSFGGSSELNKFSEDEGAGNCEKVELMSVDDVAAMAGVDSFDIIKMDVEGFEKKTIAGAVKIMHENSPIIFYEIKEAKDVHFELIDSFKDIGYDSYFYVPGRSMLVKYSRGTEIDDYLLNMIAVKPESLGRFEGVASIEESLQVTV